jgi:putative membrane protein
MDRVLLSVALFLWFSGSFAQQPAAPGTGAQANQPLSAQDAKWLRYAAQDNQGEIQLCLLAEKRAQRLAVRAFARLMVDDHVQIESQLASVASDNPDLLPNDFGQDSQKTLTKLQPLQGPEFDREFIKAQIEDHTNDIKKFTMELESTQNTDIRRYAAMTLPLLRQHLQLAQAVQSQMQAGKA